MELPRSGAPEQAPEREEARHHDAERHRLTVRPGGRCGHRRARGGAARDHQALPGGRGQPRHRHHGGQGQRARHRRRERGRQVDPDEDPLRHAAARRGRDQRRRAAVTFANPSDAIGRGIGMVHQHFMLADNLTVLENVVLGAEPRSGLRLDVGAARRRIRELGEQYGLEVDPDALVEDLGRGRPPARRDPQGPLPGRPDPHPRRAHRRPGAAGGRRALRRPARAQGRGPVDHLHLAQARRGAERRRRHHRDPAGHHRRHRRAGLHHRPRARRAHGGQRAAVPGDDDVHRHHDAAADGRAPDAARAGRAPAARRRQFTIHRGEVLGIAGVEGNGQAELVETLLGTRTPAAGRVLLGDETSPRGAPGAGARPGSATSPRTAPARAAARGPPLGEPDPRSPDPEPERARPADRPARGARRHRADRARVRRPHARRSTSSRRPSRAATSRSSSSGAR